MISAKRRARAILDRRRRPADVNEPGDALVVGKADRGAKPAVVGHPSGEPGGGESERAGGDDHVHAHRARGQDLFPLRDLGVRRGARDDGDDERRAHEAPLFLGPRGLVQVRPVGEADLERKRARALARFSLDDHEPPGRELAVIGHPRGDGKDRRQLVRRSDPVRSSSAAARICGVSGARSCRSSLSVPARKGGSWPNSRPL